MNLFKRILLINVVGVVVCICVYLYLDYNYVSSTPPYPFSTDFEDIYFKPLLDAFRKKKKSHNILGWSKSKRLRLPTFLLISTRKIPDPFWKQQLSHITLNECPMPCSVTTDRRKASEVDAIVFYLREMEDDKAMQKFVPKRDPKQPWVMLSFEAALLGNSKYNTNYDKFNGLFNRTMMHRTDADVFTPHGFIVHHLYSQFLPYSWTRLHPLSLGPYPKNSSKRLVVSFISNCKPTSGRHKYIRSMQKFTNQIDIYGKCGKYQCGNRLHVHMGYRTDVDKCLKMAGEHYLFYLAFENSFCKDYVSEKLYNLLYHPIVPIVMGGAEYHKILPPFSYIDASHYTPEQLVNYLLFLKNNPVEYHKYFSWRAFYRPSTIGGVRSMCHLCVRLHDPTFYEYKVYEDFYNWFYTEANCSWTWKPDAGVVQIT